MTKNLFIKTYGCQMNSYDSDRMVDLLAPIGYKIVATPDDADLVIVNTCHVREHASEKTFSELGRLSKLKQKKAKLGKMMLIAVTGCVAQAEGEEIIARAPYVDIVLGPQTYHRLPELIAHVSRKGGRELDTSFPPEPKFDYLPPPHVHGSSAFISVQEGCDKFCSFCVVPYTRGMEYSRSPETILAEARELIAQGVLEITLLGQNVSAYHGENRSGGVWGLGQLITSLAKIDGLARLRYTTSHPRDIDESLIAAHRDVPILMPFLHLPVQSGSDTILAAMNRQHNRKDYLRLVEKLRKVRPDLAISSDFIVGFPGESDKDFADSLNLIQEVGFAQSYSFKYSPRPGTPAAAIAEQIPESVKEARLQSLHETLEPLVQRFNRKSLGQITQVLFERNGRHKGQLIGRTPYMQAVFAEAPVDMMNSIQNLKIIASNPNSLKGELLLEAKNPPYPPFSKGEDSLQQIPPL